VSAEREVERRAERLSWRGLEAARWALRERTAALLQNYGIRAVVAAVQRSAAGGRRGSWGELVGEKRR